MTLKTKADSTKNIPLDSKLKRLLLYYAVSALCATVLISGSIITGIYITSLTDTLNKFQTLKINSIKMKEASKNMGETAEKLRLIFPSYDKTEQIEGAILTSLDSIKSHMKHASISITNFEKKGGEIILPVALTGAIRDYALFIYYIGYLQSLNLPLCSINDVTISNQSNDPNSIMNFEIRGALKMRSVNMGGHERE